jgi:hypothetical protein
MYLFFQLRMIQAMIFCRQHGYELVQIESQEELELIQAQLLTLGTYVLYFFFFLF